MWAVDANVVFQQYSESVHNAHNTVQLMQCQKYYISLNMAPRANSQMEVTTMQY